MQEMETEFDIKRKVKWAMIRLIRQNKNCLE